MGHRTSRAVVAALLAITVILLSPGPALADDLEPGELKAITDARAGVPVSDPGELKARIESFAVPVPVTEPGQLKALMESFAYERPEITGLQPGEWKKIAEAPARFAVVDPGELKALMESGVQPIASDEGTTVTGSEGIGWTGVGVGGLLFLFAIGAVVIYGRRRRDHTAPA